MNPFSYAFLEPDLAGFIAAVGLTWWMIFQFARKLRISLIIAVAYTVLPILFDLYFTRGFKIQFVPFFQPFEHYTEDWKALFWLITPLAIASLSKKAIHRLGLFVFVVACVLTVRLWFTGIPNGVVLPLAWTDMGLLYNPSMNPALLVVLLPFTSSYHWIFRILAESFVCFIVLHSGQITPLAIYTILQTFRLKNKWWVMVLPISLTYILKSGVFNWISHGSDRLVEYFFFWHQWREFWGPWFGMGSGKFVIYGPLLQYLMQHKTLDIWAFLHSDWYELLVQQGIIGALAWSWVFFEALYRNWYADRVLFIVTLGIGIWGITYFPLHTSAGALVLMLCLAGLKK